MVKLTGNLRILPKEGGSRKKEIIYIPEKAFIDVGSGITCDIRFDNNDVIPIHFKIYVGSCGKVKINNLSTSKPIIINDKELREKTFLNSGDIITLVGRKMQWELKSESKKRLSALSKHERKLHYIKTNRRVTINSSNSSSNDPSTSTDVSDIDSLSAKSDLKTSESDDEDSSLEQKESEKMSQTNENILSATSSEALEIICEQEPTTSINMEFPSSQELTTMQKLLARDDDEHVEIPETQVITDEMEENAEISETQQLTDENEGAPNLTYEDEEIPETQNFEDELNENSKTTDSAIESFSSQSKYKHENSSNDETKVANVESSVKNYQITSAASQHESLLFSDTEFSQVDLNPTLFGALNSPIVDKSYKNENRISHAEKTSENPNTENKHDQVEVNSNSKDAECSSLSKKTLEEEQAKNDSNLPQLTESFLKILTPTKYEESAEILDDSIIQLNNETLSSTSKLFERIVKDEKIDSMTEEVFNELFEENRLQTVKEELQEQTNNSFGKAEKSTDKSDENIDTENDKVDTEESGKPVIEEICIKKHVYSTTDDDDDDKNKEVVGESSSHKNEEKSESIVEDVRNVDSSDELSLSKKQQSMEESISSVEILVKEDKNEELEHTRSNEENDAQEESQKVETNYENEISQENSTDASIENPIEDSPEKVTNVSEKPTESPPKNAIGFASEIQTNSTKNDVNLSCEEDELVKSIEEIIREENDDENSSIKSNGSFDTSNADIEQLQKHNDDGCLEPLESNLSSEINILIATPSETLEEIASIEPISSSEDLNEHVELLATQDILNDLSSSIQSTQEDKSLNAIVDTSGDNSNDNEKSEFQKNQSNENDFYDEIENELRNLNDSPVFSAEGSNLTPDKRQKISESRNTTETIPIMSESFEHQISNRQSANDPAKNVKEEEESLVQLSSSDDEKEVKSDEKSNENSSSEIEEILDSEEENKKHTQMEKSLNDEIEENDKDEIFKEKSEIKEITDVNSTESSSSNRILRNKPTTPKKETEKVEKTNLSINKHEQSDNSQMSLKDANKTTVTKETSDENNDLKKAKNDVEENEPEENPTEKVKVEDNSIDDIFDELKTPVIEEACIQKFAYATTKDTKSEQKSALKDTPSRRRGTRINYSELAGTTSRTPRRGRSASIEKDPSTATKLTKNQMLEKIDESNDKTTKSDVLEKENPVNTDKEMNTIEIIKNVHDVEASLLEIPVKKRARKLNYQEATTSIPAKSSPERSESVDKKLKSVPKKPNDAKDGVEKEVEDSNDVENEKKEAKPKLRRNVKVDTPIETPRRTRRATTPLAASGLTEILRSSRKRKSPPKEMEEKSAETVVKRGRQKVADKSVEADLQLFENIEKSKSSTNPKAREDNNEKSKMQVNATPEKNKRAGRRKVAEKRDAEAELPLPSVETPQQEKKSGRRRGIEENTEIQSPEKQATKSRKGRAQRIQEQEVIILSSQEEENQDHVSQKTASLRGRPPKVKKTISPEESKQSFVVLGRKRRNATKNVEVVEESQYQEEQAVKPRRGRLATKTRQDDTIEQEAQVGKERKIRNKAEVVELRKEPSPKSTQAHIVEENIEEIVNKPVRKARARQIETIEKLGIVEIQNELTPQTENSELSPTRKTRDRGGKSKEDEASKVHKSPQVREKSRHFAKNIRELSTKTEVEKTEDIELHESSSKRKVRNRHAKTDEKVNESKTENVKADVSTNKTRSRLVVAKEKEEVTQQMVSKPRGRPPKKEQPAEASRNEDKSEETPKEVKKRGAQKNVAIVPSQDENQKHSKENKRATKRTTAVQVDPEEPPVKRSTRSRK